MLKSMCRAIKLNLTAVFFDESTNIENLHHLIFRLQFCFFRLILFDFDKVFILSSTLNRIVNDIKDGSKRAESKS